MNEDKLNELSAAALGIVTTYVEAGKNFKKDELQLYAEARAEELAVHFDYEAKPDNILQRVRPREDDAVKDYRLNSYVPITFSFIQRVMNYLQRLFNPALFTLRFTDADTQTGRIDDTESIRSYLTTDLPRYGSLTGYLRDFAMEEMFSDPNAWVVIWTDYSDAQLFEDKGPDALQEPYPKTIRSKDAFLSADGSMLISESSMKSLVMVGDKEQRAGRTFFIFGRGYTFHIYQVGKVEKDEFEVMVWNKFPGDIPLFTYMGGKPARKRTTNLSRYDRVVYDSHIQAAIPFLNKAVSHDSDQMANIITHVFPQKWESAIECPTCHGNGHVTNPGRTGETMSTKICDTCNGAGVKNASSVFTKIIVSRDHEGKLDPTPPAGYVTVPIDTVEFMEDKIRKVEQQALDALNMGHLAKRDSAQVESADAKRISKDALNTTLETIRKDIDRIGMFCAIGINLIRYGAVMGEEAIWENTPTIAAPSSFDIETPEETMASVKEAKDAGAGTEFIRRLIINAAITRFGEGSHDARRIQATVEHDPFFGMDEQDIADLASVGATQRRSDLTKHLYISDIINQAIEANPDFLRLPFVEQRAIVDQIASTIATDGGNTELNQ